jgi:hypothetical protein
LGQVIQHTAQIGVGLVAQSIRMPFMPMFIVRRSRKGLIQPIRGRYRMPSPVFKAMLNAVSNVVQMPPKRGPQQGRHQQGVQPNRQA